MAASSVKSLLQQRLSSKAIVAVLAIATTCAIFGYFGRHWAEKVILERKVRAALPIALDAVRQQRARILAAMEAYKRHYGFYPPDHVTSRQPIIVDPVKNQLFYELVGAAYNPATREFSVGTLIDPLSVDELKEFLGVEEIKNSSTDPLKVWHFLPADPLPNIFELPASPDFCVLAFSQFELGLDWRVAAQIKASTWRYVASAPGHNPGAFDLWIEIEALGKQITIGNWKAAE